MFEFFRILDELGIRGKTMAARMGYAETRFSMVRSGKNPPSARFRRDATRALTEMGIRNANGAVYTEDDLFQSARARLTA